MARNKRPRYLISVVADMFDVHPQTLRTYEREGLIRPARSQGNTRLYSDEDVARIELILRLTKELGVNLAGVEVVLNMRERMERSIIMQHAAYTQLVEEQYRWMWKRYCERTKDPLTERPVAPSAGGAPRITPPAQHAEGSGGSGMVVGAREHG